MRLGGGRLRLRSSLGRNLDGRLLDRRRGIIHDLILLVNQVPEDIVEDVVAIGLLGKNKSLDELAGRLRLVGDLANDGDQDVAEGGLGIDVQDADLAFLEVELLDLLADSL
jgi:hypothetical protein